MQADSKLDLRIRWFKYVNFLILLFYCGYVEKCPHLQKMHTIALRVNGALDWQCTLKQLLGHRVPLTTFLQLCVCMYVCILKLFTHTLCVCVFMYICVYTHKWHINIFLVSLRISGSCKEPMHVGGPEASVLLLSLPPMAANLILPTSI
jgi:hypothetical protein